MAERDLNIKFKVDASEVASKSDEAKNKVKQAADQMASEVKYASDQMKSSFEGVAKSTEQISEATKDASSAVKQMEGQVASSSKSMEANLDSVSKKMSAMQAFHMGARGIGMLGGAAQSVLRLYGDEETADNVATATSIGQSGFQGAAMGFAAGGPWGAAVGGLIGAGSVLLEAAVKQKEAAEATLQANRGTIEAAEKQNNDRALANWVQEQATAKNFDVEFAQDQIDAAKDRIAAAQARLNSALDVAKGRVETQYNGPSFSVDGKVLQQDTNFGSIDWADKQATSKLEDQLGSSVFEYLHGLVTESVQSATQELADAEKELALLAPLQARIEQARVEKSREEQQQLLEQWKSFDEYQNGAMAEAKKTNAIVAEAFADKQKRDRKAFIDSLKSTWIQDVDNGRAFRYFLTNGLGYNKIIGADGTDTPNKLEEAPSKRNLTELGAELNLQFNTAKKALDDFVSSVQKEMAESGRDSTPEEAAKLGDLKDAFDLARDMLKAFNEVEKYSEKKDESDMAELQAKLNGKALRTVSEPTDQLTRIGGGVGYSSYNSSVEQVQKSIDESIKTLIANQNNQNNQIISELRDIKLSNPDAKFG